MPLSIKQQITSTLFEKDTTWGFWRVNWILRVHMYLLIWRKIFFSFISIVSLNQISKLTKLICLHFTGCRNYTKILINHASYLILVTALLPSYLSIKHPPLTAVKDYAIKYSEPAFSNSNVNYFWSIKNLSEVIEKLRLRNFQGSQVSSFCFSTLYTFLPHDLIKEKVLSLVKWCFNRELKTYICTSDKAGFFSNEKYDSL